MHTSMHWTDQIHRLLIEVADTVSRIDVDARLLAASDVKLDRALFPLLSRLTLYEPITTVELANLIGRDHSTVSRQISKLEELDLVERVPNPEDRRARILRPNRKGRALLAKIAKVRRQWIENRFQDWSGRDRDHLIELMARMMEGELVGAVQQDQKLSSKSELLTDQD